VWGSLVRLLKFACVSPKKSPAVSIFVLFSLFFKHIKFLEQVNILTTCYKSNRSYNELEKNLPGSSCEDQKCCLNYGFIVLIYNPN